jgi:glycosyltransferase involved in cell wall biosynthesis
MKGELLQHCVVITCFDCNQPGFLDFSYRINSLAKEYRLTIVSQADITQPELLLAQAKYQVISIGNGKLGWLSYLLKCGWLIRQQKPDIVVLLHSAAAPIALLTASIPTCLYWNEHPTNLIHLPTKFSPIRRMITVLLHKLIFFGAKKANLIMPIGEDHQIDLCLHRVDQNKIKMIYMGVSERFLVKRTINQDGMKLPLRLIYVGTVSVQRGRDVMLDAMAILAKEHAEVHLTIIGANEEQLIFCEQRIQHLKIKDYVTVLGRISGEQVPNYLQQADFGICLWEKSPWYEFNPPTKLFEYLTAGLPVLASNIRTHTRYIQDWNNGLIFEYDKTSLAKAISSLYQHRNRIQSLKHNANAAGLQYSWNKLEKVFLQSVRSLLSSKALNK